MSREPKRLGGIGTVIVVLLFTTFIVLLSRYRNTLERAIR